MMKTVLLFCVVLGQVTSQLTWELVDTGGPVGVPPYRRDAVFGYDAPRDQFILFGGRPGPLGDTWIFKKSTKTWEEVNTTGVPSPPARFSAVGGVSKDYFYVTTGEQQTAGKKIFFNDIWRFDLVNKKWEELPAQPQPNYLSSTVSPAEWLKKSKMESFVPAERYGSAGGIYPGSDRLFVSLGFASVRYFDTFTYNVEQLGWFREFCDKCNPYDPRYPHARCLHGGALAGRDELVIFGGCLTGGSTGGPCPAGDSWLFDNRAKTWKRLSDCATPRVYSSMALLPGVPGRRRMVLYGGIENLDQVFHTSDIPADAIGVLDPDNGEWTIRKAVGVNPSASVPVKRASASMVTTPDGVYMFGGVNLTSQKTLNDLWILKGDAAAADKAPKMSCQKNFVNMIIVHGIFMVIGWGFFLQWGAFIARYMRFKDPLWFYLHIAFQIFGLCCSIAGFVFGVLSVQFDHFKFAHAVIGLVTMILGILQPINALFRPHKPEPGEAKSVLRRLWEWIHHFGGRSALFLALINISLGVFLAVAQVVIWALWFGYMCLIVAAYALMETARSIRGRKRVVPIGDSTSVQYYSGNKGTFSLNEVQKEPPVDYANPAVDSDDHL